VGPRAGLGVMNKSLPFAPAGSRTPVPGPSGLLAMPTDKMTCQDRNSKRTLSEHDRQASPFGLTDSVPIC
jgi:hypothetical protein